MKTLINAIQNALRDSNGLPDLRDGDIFKSPTVNYLPEIIRGRGIGLVPGQQLREERLGGLFRVTRTVRVVAWVNMLKTDDEVDGILDLADAVDEVLYDNFLGLPAIELAFCRTISAPTVFGSKTQQGRFLVQLVMDYQYESEEASP